jgi:hypothetical protein
MGEEVGAQRPRRLLGDYILKVALRMSVVAAPSFSMGAFRWRGKAALSTVTRRGAAGGGCGQLTSTVGVKM